MIIDGLQFTVYLSDYDLRMRMLDTKHNCADDLISTGISQKLPDGKFCL